MFPTIFPETDESALDCQVSIDQPLDFQGMNSPDSAVWQYGLLGLHDCILEISLESLIEYIITPMKNFMRFTH